MFTLLAGSLTLAIVSVFGALLEGLYYLWFVAALTWLLLAVVATFGLVAFEWARSAGLLLGIAGTAVVLVATCSANIDTYCADHGDCQFDWHVYPTYP